MNILILSILGLQAIKGHNIVNIYKMMFYPLKSKGPVSEDIKHQMARKQVTG